MTIDFGKVELDTSNLEPRCPCVLLLDTSGSMAGPPITELNAGLHTFKSELLKNPLARLRVEIAVVTFPPARVAHEFTTVDQFEPPTLEAAGDTPMGTAINLALDKIDERKKTYKQNRISYLQPWVFLITDGAPTDGEAWEAAAKRVWEREKNKKVVFFSVGVAGADMNILKQIGPREPYRLEGLDFQPLFIWLSASLSGQTVSDQPSMGAIGI